MKVTVNGRSRTVYTVDFDPNHNEVILIDQRRLPHRFQFVRTKTYHQTAIAIQNMTVRGAGAIGATAAFGLAQGILAFRGKKMTTFTAHIEKVFNKLAAARPTAIDPLIAMRKILSRMNGNVKDQQKIALKAAWEFSTEDVAECRAIGRHGAKLLRSGMNILTHCNAGALAFVDVGTATAPFYTTKKRINVYCTETRPRCQGAALTAWELAQQGVPHCLIADTAAGHLMQNDEIDMVITGSDRVLGQSGEVVNKIGTYQLAVLAQRHRIPFYVAIPRSTLDWETLCSSDIPIEERTPDEVLGAVTANGWRRIANQGSTAQNPAFDITPANLITGLITPIGIVKPSALRRYRTKLQMA